MTSRLRLRIGESGSRGLALLGQAGLATARWVAVASWLGAASFAGATLDIPLEGPPPALAPRGLTPTVPSSHDETPSHDDSDLESWEETPA